MLKSDNSGKVSEVDPLSTTSAILLIVVGIVFASILMPPFFFMCTGKEAAVFTRVDVPVTKIRSALLIIYTQSSNIFFGIGSPNKTVSYLIIPPHSHIGGKIFKLINSLEKRKPHFIHLHLYLLP